MITPTIFRVLVNAFQRLERERIFCPERDTPFEACLLIFEEDAQTSCNHELCHDSRNDGGCRAVFLWWEGIRR